MAWCRDVGKGVKCLVRVELHMLKKKGSFFEAILYLFKKPVAFP